MPDDTETIALRATVIGGNDYPDDYQVIWRGRSIGRIMKGSGSPNHAPQWWWKCNTYANRRSATTAGPAKATPLICVKACCR